MFLGDKFFSISLNVKTTSWSTTVYPPMAATDEALGEEELEIRNYKFKHCEVEIIIHTHRIHYKVTGP